MLLAGKAGNPNQILNPMEQKPQSLEEEQQTIISQGLVDDPLQLGGDKKTKGLLLYTVDDAGYKFASIPAFSPL